MGARRISASTMQKGGPQQARKPRGRRPRRGRCSPPKDRKCSSGGAGPPPPHPSEGRRQVSTGVHDGRSPLKVG
eukprot:3849581-Prymnesium_polylepis.1